jgi:hypothetical protein
MFSIFPEANRLNLLPGKTMRIEKWIKQYQPRMAFDLPSRCPVCPTNSSLRFFFLLSRKKQLKTRKASF